MAYGIDSMSAKAIKTKIIKNKLFDEEYYLSFIEEDIVDALEHYLTIGYKEGLNPSTYFDTNCYLENNVDVDFTDMNPLAHYVVYALGSDRKVKYNLSLNDYKKFIDSVYNDGLFDEKYYLSQCKEEDVVDALEHYITIGAKKGYNPSYLFDTNNYIKNNSEVNEKGLNPLVHYILYSYNSEKPVKFDLSLEELKQFRKKAYQEYLFDDAYYLSNIKDTEIIDPLDHYLTTGYKMGYNPSEFFDTACYLDNNLDVKESGINPLLHYVLYALGSNRKVKFDLTLSEYKNFKEKVLDEKLFDEDYYISQCSEEIYDPLTHYLTKGYKKGLNPSEFFDTSCYLDNNLDVKESGINPLLHYVLYALGSNRKVKFDLTLSEYKNFKEKVLDEKLFDEDYYISQCSEEIYDPFTHYFTTGWKEGKNPSYRFNTNIYLSNNNDVKKSGKNPLYHFIIHALESKRKFNYDLSYIEFKKFEKKVMEEGFFEEEYYLNQLTEPVNDPLGHYLSVGWKENKNPSYIFDTNKYLEYNHNAMKKDMNPLLYFISHAINSNRKMNYGMSYSQFLEFGEKARNLGLFDDEYYLVTNPDIQTVNPLAHYLTIGYIEGRNPSGLFETECYLENSLDVTKLGLNPLIHYVNNAYDSNRKIKCNLSLSNFMKFKKFIIKEGFYDEAYYIKQCENKIIDPLDHYLTVGWKEGKNPSVLFNTNEYLKYNEDVIESGMNPLLHYVRYGMQQERIFNFGLNIDEFKNFLNVLEEENLFDEEYYLGQCTEEIEYPLYHYLTEGYKLGYDPSLNFSTTNYLRQYRDIANDGRNPLVHFCQYGINEDRIAKFNVTLSELKEFREKVVDTGLFDEEYYLSQCNEENIEYPLDHYVEKGSKEGYNPSVFFNTNNYIENNSDVLYLNKNPLVHYVIYALGTNRKVNHDMTLNQYRRFRDFVIEEKYFDEEYYISNLKRDEQYIDALEHYLTLGFKEGYNPSEKFNTNEYTEKIPSLKNQNPLIHYIMNLLNAYDTLSQSEMFDEEFYLTHLDDYVLSEEDIKQIEDDENFEKVSKYDPEDIDDPLMHYLTVGVYDGLNPNAYFSSYKYLEWNPDVKESGMDPLYHYIKYGKYQSRDSYMVLSNHLQKFDKRYKIHSTSNMLKALKKKVSVIIPIYNAFEETKDCITSVLRNTHIDYELLLINDCSTDKRIDELLCSLRNISNIKIINNKENQGFIKNVNMAIDLTENDVVLLNSDTIVTPHWLSHIVYCAYSSNEIGTVTPFSNASDISILEFDYKDFNSINNSSYKLDKLSYNLNMEAPTGNGFCLFIKRECIDDVGLFDETFGKGYGEETDFTYRALNQGWLNIRNDSVLIYHRRHASFKKENTDNLKARNKKILEERYPSLYQDWDEFAHSRSLQDSLERIRLHYDDLKKPERVLYVTGIENNEPIIDDDYHNIADYHDTFIITLHSKQIKLGVLRDGRFVLYEKWNIDSKWDQNTFASLYTNILLNLKIDLVYIKYLYSYYNPNNQDLSLFIQLLSRFEIQALYEATCDQENIHNTIHELLNPMESLKEIINKKNNEIDFNKYKLVVYTALTGNYDELVTPSVINPKFDYICFTDNPNLKSDFWTIKLMEDTELDKIRKARKYKILPHKYLKKYDYSLWIDANFDIIGDIEEYIHRYSVNNKLLVIKHDIRNDIYEEAEECILLEKDNPEIINEQMDTYRKDEYPENNGLIASGIIFRDHNDHEIKTIMNEWYHEVYTYSRRDQLSFNYVCWKNNYQYDESPLFYFKNQYFQRLLHVGDNNLSLKYDEESISRILDSFNNKTSIIIPIYNAFEETKACIESVLKYTTTPYHLLLIDDCSTDARIKELLSTYEDNQDITVIYNKSNQGFVRNINTGFEKTSDDVIILNSDTEVTPKWLQKLKIAAYSNEKIATVTPLSNNAGAFSVPIVDEDNELQPELGLLGTSNIIEKISKKDKIYVPTGNGFCMYIKREAIYSVGFFDQVFGMGYCEENDFCMRLMEKGWLHIIDPSTYVYHKHNVSFSSMKEELYENNRQILEEMYPHYSLKLLDMLRSYDLVDIRQKIAVMLESENNKKFDVKRILYLIHEGTGGTLHTSIELMGNLPNNMEPYLLTAGKEEIRLYKYTRANTMNNNTDDDDEFLQHLTLLSTWNIKSEYSIKQVFNKEFKRIYFNVLYSLKIDLIHIRHLIRHSFDMPYIAKQMGIPVILSFHDFYYVCPSHNLIDDNEEYCGGYCSQIKSKHGQCDVTGGLNAPILKTYVSQWRKNVKEMFENCDAFVTTSQSAYDIYTEFYPELNDKTFKIIEHGRDVKTPDKINVPPIDGQKTIKILFPGHINVNKGGWLIKAIKELDNDNKLEFHYMGNIHSKFKLEEIGTHHGYYKRSKFCEEVNKINPHFIGLFSIWPETYCHTLTESWGCGIPVITIDMGALGERVHRHGGGYFIENNPQKAYDKIIQISQDKEEYEKTINQITKIEFKSTKQMATEYMNLYEEILFKP